MPEMRKGTSQTEVRTHEVWNLSTGMQPVQIRVLHQTSKAKAHTQGTGKRYIDFLKNKCRSVDLLTINHLGVI